MFYLIHYLNYTYVMGKELKKAYAHKKFEHKEVVNHYLMSNGVAHFVCVVRNRDEIINHFSPKGYELLSDEFSSYISESSLNLPDNVPVLIEITGCEFSEEDQDAIRNAIWSKYELLASYKQKQRNNSKLRVVWFALILTIVCICIVLLKDTTRNQIYLNLFFILFYFFGDFIIRTPLLENKNINKERIKYIQLSRARVFFSGNKPLSGLSDEQVKRITNIVLKNINDED